MTDPQADVERTAWLETCTEFERELILAYLIGYDPDAFDQARRFVERGRAGAFA